MERLRKPLQGLTNIIRFNWHFYVLAGIALVATWAGVAILSADYALYGWLLTALVVLPLIVSLGVSAYVYDFSGVYEMPWLSELEVEPEASIVNLHAGFDEFSAVLQQRFPRSSLQVFDFYNEARHTEVSIKRARRAYPEFPGTKHTSTDKLPIASGSVDVFVLAFAAHEIRSAEERSAFFRELNRCLKPEGRIVLTEHLRDLPNFLAYTVGFFHFLPQASWFALFRSSGLTIRRSIKTTPFVTTYILSKHGAAS